ncbi:hypothetical protein QUA83_17370 [Microcoleus sp. K1-B1]|uniref:hypothetical protein n=1 Tax=Microcoleus sp. K1-B6 TaxID=2818787 RepID=UPI002FD86AE2
MVKLAQLKGDSVPQRARAETFCPIFAIFDKCKNFREYKYLGYHILGKSKGISSSLNRNGDREH